MTIVLFDIDTADIVVRSRDTEHMPSPQNPGPWSNPSPFVALQPGAPETYALAFYGAAALLGEPEANASSIVVSVNVGSADAPIRTVDYEFSKAPAKA